MISEELRFGPFETETETEKNKTETKDKYFGCKPKISDLRQYLFGCVFKGP